MQLSESSLNSFALLKFFLAVPLPLSLESVFLVANAPCVLFIICKVLAHVMRQVLYLCVLESPGAFVEFEVPPFRAVLSPTAPMLVAIRGNGVNSIFLPLRFYKVDSSYLWFVCHSFILCYRVSQEYIQLGLYGTRTFSLILAHCIHSGL